MLSKRLRRRLRQIDDRDSEQAASDERPEEASQPDASSSAVPLRAGLPGLPRARRQEPAPVRKVSERPSGSLQELAPGVEVQSGEGSYWLVDGPACELLPHGGGILSRFEHLTRSPESGGEDDLQCLRGLRPSELVLLDTETAGLSSAPVFMVGLIVWNGDEAADAVSIQMLARDYAEERAVLAASAELLRGCRVLITYNGKSFDLPLMRERMVYHGIGPCPQPPTHLDLLHLVRARFRNSWENCRLQTVEQNLCGRSRWDDIEGSRIPDAYHDFVHSGDAGLIAQVLEHNRLDLITMLEVLPHL